MATQGVKMVRFRGRYYIDWHYYDSCYSGLSRKIVDSIPADPGEYKKWLEQMRAKYAAKQNALEKHVYEIRDGSKPVDDHFRDLMFLPSELPRLDDFDCPYHYIINLDYEILTINYGAHWKLGNIPRKDNLRSEIRESIYPGEFTIAVDTYPDEHITSPALELPEPNPSLGYQCYVVAPKLDISEARKAFRTRFLAEVLSQHKDQLIKLGMEWSPVSFPFRELTFALVSIASGTAGFFSFPAQQRSEDRYAVTQGDPWSWIILNTSPQIGEPRLCGFFDKELAGNHAPLLEFGSMSHQPGEAPGVSPAETMYWHEGVLVSLALRPDGEAITQAVSWGLDQGRKNFQIVVLSLFEVAFAEVSFGKGKDEKPLVKITKPVYLSALRQDYCQSTHPRERPEWKPNTRRPHQHGRGREVHYGGTARRLQSHFPGLAALVNFFEIAANRRAASKLRGILPSELYDTILEFVDYDTWKICASVSTEFRYSCLRKYRVDDKTRIVAGPFVRSPRSSEKGRLLSFEFQNMETGRVLPAMQTYCFSTQELNWMPLIGSDRKALMLNVVVQFEPAVDIPVENDSEDEF
ncbi:hypothetical protein EV127DRAFT_441051 [Xylaria flabelliformis]|nr:hypothetical protein EV127DRAFT_441051 [Xylaria flabelliformis]